MGAIFATLAHPQSDSRPAPCGIEDDGRPQARFSGRDDDEILSRQRTARRDDIGREPSGRRGGVGGTPHGHALLGGAVCLQWPQTLGGACSRGGRGAATAGRSARTARPDVSHDARVYAPHGEGRWGSAAGARGLRGAPALPQHHGGGVKPDGLSLAQSDQSQAAEKDQGNRGHLCQYKKKDPTGEDAEQVKRLSMDCKATVNIGAFSRGGQTRGDHKASDHDLGCKEKYIPCGIVDEDTAQRYVTFGSSFKTSDFIVDTLAAWWQGLSAMEQGELDRVQIKMDNGPERRGVARH